MHKFWKNADVLLERIHYADNELTPQSILENTENVDDITLCFLELIDYISISARSNVVRSTALTNEVFNNRLALLKLVQNFEKLFVDESPLALGVRFFGAILSPANHGIRNHPRSSHGSAGKDICPKAAFEGCVGEAAEFLSFLRRPNDNLVVQTAPGKGFAEAEWNWINGILAQPSSSDDSQFDSIEVKCLQTGRLGLAPSELILRHPSDSVMATPKTLSNGVGAGADYDSALMSGIFELIERDAVALWWYGHKPAKSIDPNRLPGGRIAEIIRMSKHVPTRKVSFLDLTTEFGIPVVASISCDINGQNLACGYGCNSSYETAASKAFLEMCQMELAHSETLSLLKLVGESALPNNERILLGRIRNLNLNDFPQFRASSEKKLEDADDNELTREKLLQTLTQAGLRVYIADITRKNFGIPVIRAIIPGLQPPNLHYISDRLLNTMRENDISKLPKNNSVTPF